jgi:hypothetical protein
MAPDSEITIVSGLPRSGTSLMLQMLQCGGMTVVTDGIRSADVDNPRGYFELEKVKQIREDASWLPRVRGQVFKMVSLLLYDLPLGEQYRVLFMERDLDEILASQEKMLQRLGRQAAPRQEMKRSYSLHLEKLAAWLQQQDHIRVLRVSYSDLVMQPKENGVAIGKFLGRELDVDGMVSAVEPTLYRHRKNAGAG